MSEGEIQQVEDDQDDVMSVKSDVNTDDECFSDCESCLGNAVKDEPTDEENEVCFGH